MKLPQPLHRWDLTSTQAAKLQETLRVQVEPHDGFDAIHTVAGIDLGYDPSGRVARAAVVLLSFPDLLPKERCTAQRPVTFPYIPGLLAFREMPAALAAFERLQTTPDLVLCDGHGLAHPRRFGLACHLGLWLDLPTIGVAKRLLVGSHPPLDEKRGAWVPIRHEGVTIGAALRTRCGVRPVYVSVGHRVSLESAVALTLKCAPRYRIPEPLRQAHRLAAHTEPNM